MADSKTNEQLDTEPQRIVNISEWDSEWGAQQEIESAPGAMFDVHEKLSQAGLTPEEQATAIDTFGGGANTAIDAGPEEEAESGATPEASTVDPLAAGAAGLEGALAAPGELGGSTPSSDNLAQAVNPSPVDPEKPTNLESLMATIRSSPESQARSVMQGDQNALNEYFSILQGRGLMRYEGGVPVVFASDKKKLEILNEIADRRGLKVIHALSMEVPRDTSASGWVANKLNESGTFVAATAKLLGVRQNVINVIMVGTEAQLAEKLTEAGQLLSKLDAKGLLNTEIKPGEPSQLKIVDGKLVPPEKGPVKLVATASLAQVISTVQDTVNDHLRSESEKQAAARAERNSRDGNASKSKDGAATERPTAYANQLKEFTATAVSSPGMMAATLDDKNLSKIPERLRAVSDLSGKPEVGNLPAPERQATIVSVAAVAILADEKAIAEKGIKAFDIKVGGRSARDQLNHLSAKELAEDPTFNATAKVMMDTLVKNKVITQAQADKALESIANNSAALAASGTSNADKAATDSAASAVVGAQNAGSIDATASTPPSSSVAAPPGAAKDTAQGELGLQDATSQSTLESRVAQLIKDGPGQLTLDKVHTLMSDLATHDGKSVLSTSAVPGGTAPTATLMQLNAIFEHVAKGEQGELSAQIASNLAEKLQGWQQLDQSRLIAEGAVSTPASSAQLEATRDALSEWTTKESTIPEPKVTAADQSASSVAAKSTAPENQAVGASSAATAPVESVVKTDPAVNEPISPATDSTRNPIQADAASATRPELAPLAERAPMVAASSASLDAATLSKYATEDAAARISALMSNPAGSFTNKDKTWNERNVHQAADAVLRLDPQQVAAMKPDNQAAVASYVTWIARNAYAGRLPGFDSPGDNRADALVAKAQSLIEGIPNGVKVSASAEKSFTKNLEKADRMVGALESREQGLASSASDLEATSRRSSGSAGKMNMEGFARDLVDAMYGKSENKEEYVKYLVKNSQGLTPDAIKGLDPATQAKTVVALEYLTREVSHGALGTLSPGLKAQLNGALKASDKLVDALHRDPQMVQEIGKASEALREHIKGNASESTASPAGSKPGPQKDDNAGAEQETKSAGRSMER